MRELVVVSGGTKGIGKSILEIYTNEDVDLVTCSRNLENLEELKNLFKSQYPDKKLYTFQADLSKKQDTINFVNYIKELSGNVSVLVNNAGLFIPGKITEEDEGSLEKMINTNLYSAYYLTRGLAPDMVKFRKGHIFNICSTASIMAYINGGSYSISKFALLGMSKVLREELKEHNVRVTSVLPGATLTASWEGTDLPKDRFMKPEDVASVVYQSWKLSHQTVVEEVLVRPQLGDI